MKKRSDRRYDGGPEYPLEKVRACTSLSQIRLSRRAQYTDGPRVLPAGTIDVFGTVKEMVLGLNETQWRFAQEKEGQWVDVYEVDYESRAIWLKLKLEIHQHSKEFAIVISFHEWDHSREI
jgi:hypothetical protein